MLSRYVPSLRRHRPRVGAHRPSSPVRRVGERGSVALVVMVLFVLAASATLMVTRDIDDARYSGEIETRAALVQASDAAVASVTASLLEGDDPPTGGRGRIGDVDWGVAVRAGGIDRWRLDIQTATGGSRRTVTAILVDHPVDGWVVEQWSEARGGT